MIPSIGSLFVSFLFWGILICFVFVMNMRPIFFYYICFPLFIFYLLMLSILSIYFLLNLFSIAYSFTALHSSNFFYEFVFCCLMFTAFYWSVSLFILNLLSMHRSLWFVWLFVFASFEVFSSALCWGPIFSMFVCLIYLLLLFNFYQSIYYSICFLLFILYFFSLDPSFSVSSSILIFSSLRCFILSIFFFLLGFSIALLYWFHLIHLFLYWVNFAWSYRLVWWFGFCLLWGTLICSCWENRRPIFFYWKKKFRKLKTIFQNSYKVTCIPITENIYRYIWSVNGWFVPLLLDILCYLY